MINSAYTPPLDLIRRPRRNRQSAVIRALLRETHVRTDDLIQPLFVKDGHGARREPVGSMPGIERLGLKSPPQGSGRAGRTRRARRRPSSPPSIRR